MADPSEPAGTGRSRPARLRDAAPERYAIIRRVTLVGAAVDLVLGLAKIAGGLLAQSQSLIADGVHSLSDLVTDVLVLFAARLARAKPDADHPYGHERIETVATVALGVVLIAIGAGIAIDSLWRLFHPEDLHLPAWWAMAVAAVSVVAKEGVYRYTLRAARRSRSGSSKRTPGTRGATPRRRSWSSWGSAARCSGSAISMRWPRWWCPG